MRKLGFFLLVVAALATLAANPRQALAAPVSIQVGDTRVVLDTPLGFADTTFIGSPNLQELAESLTSPSNRVLMFAITDGDMRRFTVGDTPEFRRYMLVATPRAMDRERMTPQSFQRLVQDLAAGTGGASATGDYAKVLEAQPIGLPVTLAELRRDANTLVILQGGRLPPPPPSGFFSPQPPPPKMLSTTALLLVRGKALSLAVHSSYDSPADLEWIRSTTLRWIEDLQRLNGR